MDKVLVTGATGDVGGHLVEELLERGREVKAGTRDLAQARERFGTRVEVVELDYERTETWDAAVMWADRIFLVPPPFDPHADEALVPFLDWAVQSGAQHLVLLSAMGIEAVEWVPLRKVERRIQQVGVPYTFLRPNWYMENFHPGFLAGPIRERGGFELSAGDGAVSFVQVRDVAAAAAEALSGETHVGREYTLTGSEALTFGAAAAILSEAAGREIRYEPVSDARMYELLPLLGWSDDQADVMVALLGSIRRGERARVTDDLPRLLGREPASLRDFAREHAEAWP